MALLGVHKGAGSRASKETTHFESSDGDDGDDGREQRATPLEELRI